MSEKHEWVSDDLCLIEKTTGVKFYGTVCTDMEFLGKYMNDLINENEQLKKENKELHFIIQQDNFAKQEGFK